MMELIGEIVRNYLDQFGIALIFISYAIVSVIIACVLFGLIRLASKGNATGTIPGTNIKIDFGGGAAGFIVTFVLLLTFHTQYVHKPKPQLDFIQVTGNTFWKGDESPVSGATVTIDRVNLAPVVTNADGFFSLSVAEFSLAKENFIRARFGEANSGGVPLDKQNTRAVKLFLPKLQNSDPAYQKKYDLYLAVSQDVTLFLNIANETDAAQRELNALRAQKAKSSEIERQVTHFDYLKGEVAKVFAKVKQDLDAVGIVYGSADVKKNLGAFSDWWNDTAKVEGPIDIKFNSPGQIQLRGLQEAMRKELGK